MRGSAVRPIFIFGKKEKIIVTRFLQWQFGIAACLSVAVGMLWNFSAATSTVLGSLLAIIPNIFFAMVFFAEKSATSSKKIVAAFYVGETLKIFLIAALLVLMLHVFDVKLAPLLLGFCGTYAVYFLMGASWSQLTQN